MLVLSREAGAWEELALGGRGAIGVNPFDVSGTADALHAALSMEPAERADGRRAARAGAGAHARPTGGPTSSLLPGGDAQDCVVRHGDVTAT